MGQHQNFYQQQADPNTATLISDSFNLVQQQDTMYEAELPELLKTMEQQVDFDAVSCIFWYFHKCTCQLLQKF